MLLWYSLEVHQWGTSTEFHNECFQGKNKKKYLPDTFLDDDEDLGVLHPFQHPDDLINIDLDKGGYPINIFLISP